jgi:tungstate transport system substrate-binding protein
MPRYSSHITKAGAVLVAAALLLAGCGPSSGKGAQPTERQSIILATTTSTQDSGLLDVLLPLFEEQTGYRVKTIAVGTGEALAMGRRGDADVLLAHAPAQEKEVVAEGAAINRQLVMHNDFLIAGPEGDPAGVHGSNNGAESVAKIAEAEARFVSRGDNSGTHIREMTLWRAAAIEPAGDGYIETGQGMGATLLIASEKSAYVLTDRGTYLAFRERIDLVPHVEGDPLFLNIYSVLEVNPQRFPKVNSAGARAFSEFLRGTEAQEIIRGFGVGKFGQPLFIPN